MRTHWTLGLAAITLLGSTIVAPRLSADGSDAAAMFERFKALEGRWQATSSIGWSTEISFEVIARGSVVMGTTVFRDAPDRTMVTMYYLDGDDLVATHYCEARNQPHLKATEIDPDRGTVTFAFAGGGNIPSRDIGHMDSAVFRFLGADRFASQWTWYAEGDEQWLEAIEYTRLVR